MPLFPPRINALLKGFTDHHSHILPGVDDGVKKMETSLKVLKHYEQLGFAEVWCTPHVMEDIPNTTEGLRSRFAELCAAYQGPIKLHLAAEYMMDALFDERLEQGDLLPLGDDGQQLLVETSYYTPPMNMGNIMERVMDKGYKPILAHPERYQYMGKEDYKRWKDRGVLLQLNLPALVGAYGPLVMKKAEWLLKENMYDYCGSDTHSIEQVELFLASEISRKIVNKVKSITERQVL